MGKTRKRLTSIVATLAVTSSLFVGSFSTNASAATVSTNNESTYASEKPIPLRMELYFMLGTGHLIQLKRI